MPALIFIKPSLCSTIITFLSVLNISLDSSKMKLYKSWISDQGYCANFIAFSEGLISDKFLNLFSDFEITFCARSNSHLHHQ